MVIAPHFYRSKTGERSHASGGGNEEGRAMKYFVTLRDTRDGYEATVEDDWHAGWPEYLLLFDWEEDDYSCDCNRSRMLYPDDESKHLECGDGTIEVLRMTREGRA